MSGSTGDVEALAYVVDALRAQERRYRSNHWRVPGGISELVEMVGFRVSKGHGGPSSAAGSHFGDGRVTESMLVTYEEAAALIGISVRTVKRRVADGVLRPVRDGGVVRLRRADVVAYVEALSGDEW